MYADGVERDLGAPPRTAWVGWIVFAGILLVVSAIFDMIWGLVALMRDEVFIVGSKGNVLNLDYTALGWIYLIGGTLVLLAGLGLLSGKAWAQGVAVIFCVLSVIGNLMVLPAYPIWTVMIIAMDLAVVYAISIHGDEMRQS